MLSQAETHAIHQELQTLTPQNQVLMGGSYLYGEANADSDLDFYLLVSLSQFIRFKKILERLISFKKKYSFSTIMLIPCWRQKPLAMYYVCGKTVGGRLVRSAHLTTICLNALKLGYFNFLRCQVVPEKKLRNFHKAIKQIVTALIAAKKGNADGELFSWRYIESNAALLPHEDQEVITLCKQLGEGSSRDEIEKAESLFAGFLERSHAALAPNLSFSIQNYLLYLFKFLRKDRRPLSLLTHPDKIVLRELRCALENPTPAAYEKLRRIVFPVIII